MNLFIIKKTGIIMQNLILSTSKCLILSLLLIFVLSSCCTSIPDNISRRQKMYEQLAIHQLDYWGREYPEREDAFLSLCLAFCNYYEGMELCIDEKTIVMHLGKPDKFFINDGYRIFIYKLEKYKIRFIIILKNNKVKTLQLRDQNKALLKEIVNNKNNVPANIENFLREKREE